jgi:hypothetical protein
VDHPSLNGEEPDMAIRPICPGAQQCANRDARITVLENELSRLRELDGIREDFANLLKEEIEELKSRLLIVSETNGFDRFRQAKIAISKALHPNNFIGDAAEQKVRGEIFKEIWPHIERIERGSMSL